MTSDTPVSTSLASAALWESRREEGSSQRTLEGPMGVFSPTWKLLRGLLEAPMSPGGLGVGSGESVRSPPITLEF